MGETIVQANQSDCRFVANEETEATRNNMVGQFKKEGHSVVEHVFADVAITLAVQPRATGRTRTLFVPVFIEVEVVVVVIHNPPIAFHNHHTLETAAGDYVLPAKRWPVLYNKSHLILHNVGDSPTSAMTPIAKPGDPFTGVGKRNTLVRAIKSPDKVDVEMSECLGKRLGSETEASIINNGSGLLQIGLPEVRHGNWARWRERKARDGAFVNRCHNDLVAEFVIDLVMGEARDATKRDELVEFEVDDDGVEQVGIELGVE